MGQTYAALSEASTYRKSRENLPGKKKRERRIWPQHGQRELSNPAERGERRGVIQLGKRGMDGSHQYSPQPNRDTLETPSHRAMRGQGGSKRSYLLLRLLQLHLLLSSGSPSRSSLSHLQTSDAELTCQE